VVDRAKPGIKITLDRERTLSFSLNAMIRFEEVTGRNLLSGSFRGTTSTKELRTLLWVCLLDEDEDLMEEEVGKLITINNITEITRMLNQMIEVSLPVAAEVDDKAGPLAESRSSG
jgi:hypothetical protein